MIEPVYSPSSERYDSMTYKRSGRSGIMLPVLALGLWQNFGSHKPFQDVKAMAHYAFDNGICHFDLANNYGPEYGTAEENFGRLMELSFRPYRDEMLISTKAGWDMWPGPYGNWGSRKYLMASLDQSLRRMKLDYVDIFYSHRHDPETPIEETMQALVDIVRQGKALYVGLSRYPLEKAREAMKYLADHDVPCLLYQDRFNIIDRAPDRNGQIDLCEKTGSGFISFSPLQQGLPRRFPYGARKHIPPPGDPDPRAAGGSSRTERRRRRARPEPGPDGPFLAPGRQEGNLRNHWSELGRSDRRRPEGARKRSILRGRTPRNRPTLEASLAISLQRIGPDILAECRGFLCGQRDSYRTYFDDFFKISLAT